MRTVGMLLVAAAIALGPGCAEGNGERRDGGGAGDAGDAGPGDDGGGGSDSGSADAGEDRPDAGPGCADDGDDDAREGAVDLGMIDDRASFPSGAEAGTIFPITDLDWVTWHVDDVPLADVQPRAELRGLAGGRRMELCAYYQCDSTMESVDCELGTAHELTAEIHGCCIVGTAATIAVKLSPSCSGTDDSGRVLVRAAQQGGDAICAPPYSLVWGDE